MINEKKLINRLSGIPELDNVLQGLIRIIDSQPQIGGWIPCSEPPRHDREVLIFNGKSYSVGYYDGKTWVNAIHPVEWQEINHRSECKTLGEKYNE